MILKWRCKFRYQRIRGKIVSHCFGEGELSLGAHFSPGSQTFEYELELPPKLSRGIMTNRTLKKLRSNENFLNRLSLIQFSERFLGPKRQLSSLPTFWRPETQISCSRIMSTEMDNSNYDVEIIKDRFVLIKFLYLIIRRTIFR